MTNRPNLWIKQARKELIKEYGGICANPECNNTVNLHFAHKQPTLLKGMGRGRKERYYDVIKNPEKYVLICKKCHEIYDFAKKYLLPYREWSKVDKQKITSD